MINRYYNLIVNINKIIKYTFHRICGPNNKQAIYCVKNNYIILYNIIIITARQENNYYINARPRN